MKFYSFSIALAFFVTVAGVVVAQSLEAPVDEFSIDTVVFDDRLKLKTDVIMASSSLDVTEALKRVYQKEDTDEIVIRLDRIYGVLLKINENISN